MHYLAYRYIFAVTCHQAALLYRVGQKTGSLCSAEILLRSARFFAEIKVV